MSERKVGKKSSKRKKLLTRVVAAAAGVVICVLAYLRYGYVPAPPAAGEGSMFANENLSAVFLGNGCTVAVIPLAVTDPAADAATLTAHARRFDVAVLTSCDDASVACADRLLSTATVKTLLVPRGLKKDELNSLTSSYPGTAIVRMPFRKAVTAGEFAFYDAGSSSEMSLALTHGTEKILFAAHPCGGTYDAAFVSEGALPGSSFTCPLVYSVAGADASASKIKTVSVRSVSGSLSFFADGQGVVAPLTLDGAFGN
ncbi:MAG: hypothetical protein IKO41_07850 [Lachnospiraceae bacterium]|nr:hypothetical protein [Lachnospiraceae bacterium]